MTTLASIDPALLAHVSGGDAIDDACTKAANEGYLTSVRNIAANSAALNSTPDQVASALSGAWSDSRAGIDLCKTRATNAINVGLRPEMLNFNQLVSP
jgi:hypothetical protein